MTGAAGPPPAEPPPALVEEQAHLDEAFAAFDAALRALTGRTSRSGVDDYADEALERMRRERVRVYTEASGPLYFGRIDRAAGGPIYVGRHAVVDGRNRVLVSNWRAPAAEPFYAATPADPRGATLRRRLDVEERRVLGFVDERLAAGGEDHLTEAIVEDITRQRVGEMRQIIATITPDQYELIRERPTPAVVIQGGPGTGKTAVGLHRAAWLLYQHPDLARQGVLVVGPNRTFIRYIAQVLPSLGEQSVEQREIGALISRAHRPVDEEPALAALKGSGRMAQVLERLLWSRLKPPAEDERVRVGRASVLAAAADVGALIDAARARTRSWQAGRTRFRDGLASLLAERASAGSARAVSLAGGDVGTAVRQAADYQRLANRVWPLATPERLVAELFKNRRRLAALAGDLLEPEELDRLVRASAPAKRLDMSPTDVALFDEARWLIDPEMRTFGHGVIDEAQNLTPMELRMVVRRARRQSLTILGDIAQRTSEAGLTTWADVLPAAGVGAFAERELLLSYRVPQDFLALAATVADGGVRVPRGVRRAPWRPLAVRVADPEALGAAAATLAEAMARHVGSVGVVAPAVLHTAVRAALAPLRAADAAREPLSSGVNLLDLHVVKGLEFDAVVVVEPAAILAERPDGGRGGLYTALTRSTRALAIGHALDLPAGLTTSPELDRAADAATAAERWAAPGVSAAASG